MDLQILLLIVITLCFYGTGGMIDYWQHARHHKKPIPPILKNYFAFFWLIMYSGLLPFLLVASSSNFNREIIIYYFGAFLIGTSIWDFTFSLIKKGVLVFDISDYWFWGGKDYPLTKKQWIIWHMIRLTAGTLVIIYLNLK